MEADEAPHDDISRQSRRAVSDSLSTIWCACRARAVPGVRKAIIGFASYEAHD